MLRYYKRAKELARGYDASIASLIDYNIGTAYVEHGHYEEAVPYLISSLTPHDLVSDEQKLLASQKLALCNFELGYDSLALKYLQDASGFRSAEMPAIYDQLLYFTNLHYVQGDRSSAEYESVLKELYQSGEESIREGYHRLLAGWLISLYTTQRKYKDALAIQTEHAYV
jgi:hypothetical protein